MSIRRLVLVPVLFCLLAGMFAAVGAGGRTQAVPTSITFGVTEDATKYSEDGGASYFATMTDLGMKEDRADVFWDENSPATILEQAFVDRMMRTAPRSGIRIVLDIQPTHARAFATNTQARIAAFASYVRQVALRYPQVREFVIGNEPNVRRFLQPQHAADGSIVSAGVYEQVLAASYDALKAIDSGIRVDALGLSPGGNDPGLGAGAESVSPVRFVAALGAAYRKSGRTKPIADVVDVHSYAAVNTFPLIQPRKWPQAGAADLDRLKQAWWDAFHGTAQPLFQETGDPGTPGTTYVKFRIDETGTQVIIDPAKVSSKLYTGRENVPVVSEATQARYYADLITKVKCDPTVATLDFFHLIDEPLLLGFQSGLLRVDGSRRPSYAGGEDGDRCGRHLYRPHGWRHATTVIGATGPVQRHGQAGRAEGVLVDGGDGEEATARDPHLPGGAGAPRPRCCAVARRRAGRDSGPSTAQRHREGKQQPQLQVPRPAQAPAATSSRLS